MKVVAPCVRKPENGARVVGHHRVERSNNQEWRLVEHAPNYYTWDTTIEFTELRLTIISS